MLNNWFFYPPVAAQRLVWRKVQNHCRLMLYTRIINLMRLARQADRDQRTLVAVLAVAWLGGFCGGQIARWL